MSTARSPENVGKPRLALIAGPTASGKSDLAVRLALAHANAVVINADSAQVYADLRVLSARPAEEEMRGVPHRLFGTWDGANACSAADWAAAAKAEIAAAHGAGRLPILVGGTGLYVRTLLDGIAPVPAIDPAVRETARAMTVEALAEAVAKEDPAAAARIGPADRQRLSRALEVVRSSGRPLSDWQADMEGGIGHSVDLAPIVLLPERQTLYARCDARFAGMVANGAVEEVEQLLARDLDPCLPILGAIGVREIAAWLRGEIDEKAMVAAGQQATRNYAKRQYTWLRHQPPSAWPRIGIQDFAFSSALETLCASLGLT